MKSAINTSANVPASSFSAIIELPVSKIETGKYQKALNKARVRRIADTFNIDRMRPIDVSYRNGRYWCFDGQHRLDAYKLLGKSTIPCIIHYNLSYEDEALLFAHQQDNVGAVQAHHKWNALVEAKDDATLEIVSIAKGQGFTIRKGNTSAHNINCVKVLQDIYADLGALPFATILKTIATAWGYMDKSTDHNIIGGIYLFVKTYRNDPKFSYERLTSRLSEVGPSLLLRSARENYGIHGDTRKVACQILKLYNKGRSSGRMNGIRLGIVGDSSDKLF